MQKMYKDLMKMGAHAAAATLLVQAVPAMAADKALLDILLANEAITPSQYDELLTREALTTEDAKDIVVKLGGGSGVNIQTRDGDYEFELGGRLHLDYAQHEHIREMQVLPVNGATTRRARLEMDGVFAGVWGWGAEIDFAENATELKDFKIGYEGDNFTVYAGNQKQPYSLSLEMSSNDIPWLERSIDNYMVAELTDRAVGVRLETSGEHWFFAGGVFGEEVDSDTQGDEGWATVGRFVYSPIIEDDKILHLGMRAIQRKIGDPGLLRIRDKTTDFSGLNIVDTRNLGNVDEVLMYGPELALAAGPLTIFSEYSKLDMQRSNFPDLEFDAWHIGAALSLTGDSRAPFYRMDAGEFKGVRSANPFNPQAGHWGGFEITARYASIDLNHGTFTGGEEEVFNAGINWYPNSNVRFLFDWAHILDTDESNTVRMYAPGMNVYTVRAQYNY